VETDTKGKPIYTTLTGEPVTLQDGDVLCHQPGSAIAHIVPERYAYLVEDLTDAIKEIQRPTADETST